MWCAGHGHGHGHGYGYGHGYGHGYGYYSPPFFTRCVGKKNIVLRSVALERSVVFCLRSAAVEGGDCLFRILSCLRLVGGSGWGLRLGI